MKKTLLALIFAFCVGCGTQEQKTTAKVKELFPSFGKTNFGDRSRIIWATTPRKGFDTKDQSLCWYVTLVKKRNDVLGTKVALKTLPTIPLDTHDGLRPGHEGSFLASGGPVPLKQFENAITANAKQMKSIFAGVMVLRAVTDFIAMFIPVLPAPYRIYRAGWLVVNLGVAGATVVNMNGSAEKSRNLLTKQTEYKDLDEEAHETLARSVAQVHSENFARFNQSYTYVKEHSQQYKDFKQECYSPQEAINLFL